MPFPRALARIETQTSSTRIWKWVVVSISFDNNHYAKLASKLTALDLKIDFVSHLAVVKGLCEYKPLDQKWMTEYMFPVTWKHFFFLFIFFKLSATDLISPIIFMC